ncbi:hypothetical protein JW948_06050 [bacterium]|nr:hypothetical protein [bacterium]
MTTEKIRTKTIQFKGIFIEILKWGLVLFLLWPLVTLGTQKVHLVRILTGIVLFVIFSGKMLYDYVIISAMKRTRISLKKDIVSFLGIILGAAFLVGIVLFFIAYFIILFVAESQSQAGQ